MTDRNITAPKKKRVSLREMQKDITRQRLLDSGLAVFEERGFTHSTLEHVASEAVVNRGTIYLHFENKAALLLAILQDKSAPLELLYGELDHLDDADRLQEFFGRVLDRWFQELGGPLSLAREAAVTDANVQAWLSNATKRNISVLTKVLEHRGIPRSLAAARAETTMLMWSEIAAAWYLGKIKTRKPLLSKVLAEHFLHLSSRP